MITPRKQNFILWTAIILTMAFVGLFSYFVILPAWLYKNEQMNTTQSLLIDQDVAENQQEQLGNIRVQVEQIRKSLDIFNVVVPADNPIYWVQNLEQLAKDTGNTLLIETDDTLSLTPQKEEKKPTPTKAPPKAGQSSDKDTDDPASKKSTQEKPTLLSEAVKLPRLGLKLTVEGDYRSITLFLKKLELLPYYVDVFSISISRNDPEKLKTADSKDASQPVTIGRNPFQVPDIATDSSEVSSSSAPQEFRPLQAILGVAIAVSQ